MSEKDFRTGLTKEEVLREIEDVIRSMPTKARLENRDAAVLAWLGRGGAAMQNWGGTRSYWWSVAVQRLQSPYSEWVRNAIEELSILLHEAQNDLRMKTVGPVNLAIGRGHVFDYMDTLRKIIEQAKSDILFVDRYLNGEFVSCFLPFVGDDVVVRLLTWNNKTTAKHLAGLLAMVETFSIQHRMSIEVRPHADHHERFVILDNHLAFLSGPSFKDGPITAGATINQQEGTSLAAVIKMHADLWASSSIEAKCP